MDVGVVFGLESLQFWMECFIACTGETGVAFVDLDVGITYMEVGEVVITRHPGGHGVGDGVGLG